MRDPEKVMINLKFLVKFFSLYFYYILFLWMKNKNIDFFYLLKSVLALLSKKFFF